MRARYVVRDGRLRKFPLGVGEALAAVGRAAFTRAGAGEDHPDLDAWGRTHLGDAAVEYLLTPFVRGIYGSQPAELGVAAAFPTLRVAPGRTLLGSVIRNSFRHHARNGEDRANGKGTNGKVAVGKDVKKKERGKRMVAPLRGMSDVTARLEQHLEERLGARFRKGASVTEIPCAPNVIISTPAYAAAELLEGASPTLARALRQVRYTPIVSVTAFVSIDALSRPVKGVGALVPAKERRRSLGILFTSSSFEGRVTDDEKYMPFAVLLGGTSQPEWVSASDAEIERMSNRLFGAYLRNVRAGRGLPLRAKIASLAALWLSLLLSICRIEQFLLELTLTVIGITLSILFLKMKTLREQEW